MGARITDIFPLLLITLLCVGVVEGGYQALEYFVLKPPVEKAVVSESTPVAKDSPEKDEQKETHDYRTILQRNLFGPPPGKGGPAASATDYAENLQLTQLNIVLMGTINSGEGDGRAIILDQGSKKQALYEVGDEIQGASVKEILRGKVILVYNDKDEMLDMSDAAKLRPDYAGKQSSVGAALGVNSKRSVNRPAVSPRRIPGRVISRPRTIRPSRSIMTE
jgi:general secretion pathway protein C